MSGWHEGPMAALDFESTDKDPELARPVTAAAIVRNPDEPLLNLDLSLLVWCGVEIPPETTKIHGVTTEQARAGGIDPVSMCRQVCAVLTAQFRAGVPVCGYNISYDLTLLDRECRRHGIEPLDLSGALIVDPLVLWKALDRYRKGSRKLTAACECFGVPLGDAAHEAGADALAAMRVAWKLAVKYPKLAAMTPGELMAFQVEAKREQAASFEKYLVEIGKPEKISGDWPLIPWRGEA